MIDRYRREKSLTSQYNLFYRSRKWISLLLLALFTSIACIGFSPIKVRAENIVTVNIGQVQPSDRLIQQAQQAYRAGNTIKLSGC